jgi:hypothetical protein
MRKVIPALVIIGLALGAWLLWPRDADVPTTTLPEAGATSTTTSTQVTSTAPTGNSTTSTDADSHVVETVAEAEEILRAFYFAWFAGIYDQNEEAIRAVVGNPRQVEAALSQFGIMEFSAKPTSSAIGISNVEILRSDADCLATTAVVIPEFRGGSSEGVQVFRWSSDGWLFVNSWSSEEDLWESDCEALLQP